MLGGSNLNFVPDCDLKDSTANGECGALSAPLGQLNIVTRWDAAVLNGWNVRPNDDEVLLGLQQQLTSGLLLDAQWTYHRFGNFFALSSLLTTCATTASVRDCGGSGEDGSAASVRLTMSE